MSIAFTDSLLGIGFNRLQPGAGFVRLDHEQVLERARQAVPDGRGDPPKDVLASRAHCSPAMRAIRDSAGSSTRCSLRLLAVFDGKKVVSMFEMTKLVNGHLV